MLRFHRSLRPLSRYPVFVNTENTTFRRFCSEKEEEPKEDEFGPGFNEQAQNYWQQRSQGLQDHTRVIKAKNGEKRGLIWNSDYESSFPDRKDVIGDAADIDSNLDDGALEENSRYQAYNKYYNETKFDVDSDPNKDISGRANDLRKERRTTGRRDFHRHKMLLQTGRTKDVSKGGVQDFHEPGYNPDYLPRFLNVSDASEWMTETGEEDHGTDLEEEFRLENPKKYDKLQRFRSPYWTTTRQLQNQESEPEDQITLSMHQEAADAQDEEDAMDDMDDGPNAMGPQNDDDENALSGASEEEPMTMDESGPVSSTEDCPDDPYGDIDLSEVQFLPPPEHDVQDRDDFMHQMLIKTGRHCKVTTGGRIFTSSALVLVGNGDGVGGLGYGKGESFSEALSLALKDAKKKLVAIHRVDNSISYQSKQKYCRARVYTWPLAKKSGVRSAYQHQTICDLFGLTDIRIKTIGRRNDHNIYKALLRCLQTSETPEMCARRRGKKVWDINKYWRVNNRARGY